MITTISPIGRLIAMIWRIWLRLAPAEGQSPASTARLNSSQGPWNRPANSSDHDPAQRLHYIDVRRRAGKAAEIDHQHPVAGCDQQHDRNPHPEEELGEEAAPQRQALRRVQLACCRPQADIRGEHATDPNHGAEDVQSEREHDHGCDHPPPLLVAQALVRQADSL